MVAQRRSSAAVTKHTTDSVPAKAQSYADTKEAWWVAQCTHVAYLRAILNDLRCELEADLDRPAR